MDDVILMGTPLPLRLPWLHPPVVDPCTLILYTTKDPPSYLTSQATHEIPCSVVWNSESINGRFKEQTTHVIIQYRGLMLDLLSRIGEGGVLFGSSN